MPTEQKVKRILRAILSADVKGYSLLMADDEAFTVRTLKTYRTLMSDQIKLHSGRVVDAPGDNLLAEFSSAVDAVQCAVEVQKALKAENATLPDDKQLKFRIGVNIGDVIQDGGSLYGEGVNIAARIEGLADPGGVCISRNAYDHICNKLNFGYEYLGEHSVKNIIKPVRVYKVLLDSKDAGKLIGEKPKSSVGKWVWPTIVVAAIIITSILWQVYQKMTAPEFEPASIEKMAFPLPDNPSIAVLPFDNLSGNPADESIADGLSESIITALSKTPKMFVIARNSTFTYKGKATKVQTIAEDLGVRYVLEGSLQKSNDQLRINVQLIDAISGNHVWAEKYDRRVTDFFTLQDDIAMKIITALNVKLTQGERANFFATGTDNLDAYLKVIQGEQVQQSFNKERVTMALKLAKEAISLDPNYPAAYYLLARVIYKEVQIRAAKFSKMGLALESIEKAISLDVSYAEAIAYKGWIYTVMKQYDKGIELAERAFAMNPNSAEVCEELGLTLMLAGNCERAIKVLEKGFRSSPMPTANYFLVTGIAHFYCKRYEESIPLLIKSISLEPDDYMGHIFLAASYASVGRDNEAKAEAAEVVRIIPSYSVALSEKRAPNKDPDKNKLLYNALRKAGLPE